MKKNFTKVIGVLTLVGLMTGCGSSNTAEVAKVATSNVSQEITVVSREEGSGTRGAFIELFGIEEKDADGNKVDHTTEEANICNSTSVAMTTVENDEAAIGYISLGAVNDSIKAVAIDGADATVDNIKDGSYKISRPFNIATKGEVSEVAQDFINYILSDKGQEVVSGAGYIPLDNAPTFETAMPQGKVIVAGSSSVTPVMEKLKEGYLKLNANAEIEIQESDSTTGMNSTLEGICDIGMASRGLKDSEKEGGLTETTIATDGIAVIVNKANSKDELSSEAVKQIFTGEVTKWDEVNTSK